MINLESVDYLMSKTVSGPDLIKRFDMKRDSQITFQNFFHSFTKSQTIKVIKAEKKITIKNKK